MTNVKTPNQIFNEAYAAGMAAGNAVTPVPMTVTRIDPLTGHPIQGAKQYHAPEGVCGFASVVIKPATSKFARWCSKNHISRPHYYGGAYINVKEFGQSLQRKEAFASAFAKVLNENGIKSYIDSRMD